MMISVIIVPTHVPINVVQAIGYLKIPSELEYNMVARLGLQIQYYTVWLSYRITIFFEESIFRERSQSRMKISRICYTFSSHAPKNLIIRRSCKLYTIA